VAALAKPASRHAACEVWGKGHGCPIAGQETPLSNALVPVAPTDQSTGALPIWIDPHAEQRDALIALASHAGSEVLALNEPP